MIRSSKTQQEAKARLMGIEAAAALMQRVNEGLRLVLEW